jgi:uncharacterized protein (TIGR02186 family)
MGTPRSWPIVTLLGAILLVLQAAAQTDMSFFLDPPEVDVGPIYAGADVLMVGVIPRDADGVIVTCESEKLPPTTVVREECVFHLWMPTKEFRIEDTPGLYLLATSKPLDDLLGPHRETVADEYKIGYSALRRAWRVECLSGEQTSDDMDVLFNGFIALKEKEGLYTRYENAVRLEPDGLFLYRFHIPNQMRIANQTVTAYAIRDHKVIRTFQRELKVKRAGAVEWLYGMAYHHSALYGIVAVLLATVAGLGAAKLFAARSEH